MAFEEKNGSKELQKKTFLFFAIHPDPVHASNTPPIKVIKQAPITFQRFETFSNTGIEY